MISAKEARTISDQRNKDDDKMIMYEIEEEIKLACEEGKTQIRHDGTISYHLMKELNRLGYFVDLGNSYDEHYFTVNW